MASPNSSPLWSKRSLISHLKKKNQTLEFQPFSGFHGTIKVRRVAEQPDDTATAQLKSNPSASTQNVYFFPLAFIAGWPHSSRLLRR